MSMNYFDYGASTPLYETVDELPEVDMHEFGRYVYLTSNKTFYVLQHSGWLPLGVNFPVNTEEIKIKLSDDIFAVKAETIPCWSDDYISNVQITIYDFRLDVASLKKGETIGNNTISNYHIDIFGFNKLSSTTLNVVDSVGVELPSNTNSTGVLNHIVNKSDINLFLTDDNVSGLYLGDPCFTVADSLILDEKHLSTISADDIEQKFFDSSSNIQFVFDNLHNEREKAVFTSITGTPRMYTFATSPNSITSVGPTGFLTIGEDEINFKEILENWTSWTPPYTDWENIACEQITWEFYEEQYRSPQGLVSYCPSAAYYNQDVDEYEFDVILGSNAQEGEPIFVVVAIIFTEDGLNRTLSVVRHTGAEDRQWGSSLGTTSQFSVVYNVGMPDQVVIWDSDVVDVQEVNYGWKERFTRIKVNRSGDNISIITSTINKFGFNYATQYSFTLNDHQILQQFKGPKPFGFGCHSQPDVWVKDPIEFVQDLVDKAPSPFLRGNGVDWTTFALVSADEVYAPMDKCFTTPPGDDDEYDNRCLCVDPKSRTVSLQQTICQLFKNKVECKDYIQFENFINSDEDMDLMIPPYNENCESLTTEYTETWLYIWETWSHFGGSNWYYEEDTDSLGHTTVRCSSGGYWGGYVTEPMRCSGVEMDGQFRTYEEGSQGAVGFVIAYKDGNHLSAIRWRDGSFEWALVYNFGKGDQEILVDLTHKMTLSDSDNWDNMMYTDIYVKRHHNEIVAKASNWGTASYVSGAIITINMDNYPILDQFSRDCSVGFGSDGVNGVFLNKFDLEALDSKEPVIPRVIYDVRTDEVWVYNCGEWMIDDCKSVCKLEKDRMYFNTVTRKLFYLACDCSVYPLLGLPRPDDPCI